MVEQTLAELLQDVVELSLAKLVLDVVEQTLALWLDVEEKAQAELLQDVVEQSSWAACQPDDHVFESLSMKNSNLGLNPGL